MPYTDLQIIDFARKMQGKGVGDDKIKQFIETAKAEQTPMQKVGSIIRRDPLAVPKTFTPTEKSFGKEFWKNLKVGSKKIVDPFIGAGKGALSTAVNVSELVNPYLSEETRPEILNKAITTNTPEQKAGFIAEQIGEFFIPGGATTRLGKVAETAKWMKRLSPAWKKAIGYGSKMGAEGLSAGTVQSAQSGEVDKDTATATTIGAMTPLVGPLVKKFFGSKGLMLKALGIKSKDSIKFDKIAQSGGYKDVSDFAIQKGFGGNSRAEMANQAYELLDDATKLAKPEVLTNIPGTFKTASHKKLINYLIKKYSISGLADDATRDLKNIAKQEEVTATNLDKIRYYADKSLPKNAYTGEEAIAVEALENNINRIRKILEKADVSNTIKKVNTDIRLFKKLIPKLESGSGVKITSGGAFGTLGTTASLGVMGQLVPGAQAFTTPAMLYKIATDVPQISGALAKISSKTSEKLPNIFKSKFNLPNIK